MPRSSVINLLLYSLNTGLPVYMHLGSLSRLSNLPTCLLFILTSKQEVYYSQVGGAVVVCLQEVNDFWRDVIIQVLPSLVPSSCAATPAVKHAYHEKLMMIWRSDRINLHGMENVAGLGMKLFPTGRTSRKKSWRIFQKAGAIVSIVSSSITETCICNGWHALPPSDSQPNPKQLHKIFLIGRIS